MLKIAIPTKNDRIDGHFGHADEFTVFTIEDDQVIDTTKVVSDAGCGCRSNIIPELRDSGVTIMLAGNMGEGAFHKLTRSGMQVIRGCHGKTEDVITAFIQGQLQDQDILCASHGKHI